jgi:flagellin
MAISANTNIPSIAAARAVHETRNDLEKAMERLSSGKRINSSSDDAAGQTVVSRMKAQISSLNQAIRNTNDGLSMLNTYEGAADEIEDILIRIRELATLAQNGTYTAQDRANADLEVSSLITEINRIASKTQFNGVLDVASAGGQKSFQVGFNGGDAAAFSFDKLDATTLKIGGTTVSGATDTAGIAAASAAVTSADAALSNLNVARATVGAGINRLEHTVSNLMNVVQRTEEARSRIEDADFATESAALARANVLAQAGTAMLAQANQSPSYILALLR